MAITKTDETVAPEVAYLTRGRAETFLFRTPVPADAAQIHALIDHCKPLDLNSTYAYLLLCHHFADTCVVAARGTRIEGFVSAYLPPAQPDVLFVWQVAVHSSARGKKLGRTMLRKLLERPGLHHVRFMETTVSPSNVPSRRMFHVLAAELGVACHESLLFGRHLFGGESHEDEVLFRIGPLPGPSSKEEIS